MTFRCWVKRACLLPPAAVLVVALAGCRCRQQPPTGLPPTADDSKASGQNPKTPSANLPDEPAPKSRWPADFQRPVDIHVELPKVPDKLRGPSPPIDEKK
jgi:hypothetical protein